MRYTGGKRKPVQFDSLLCDSCCLSTQLQLGSLLGGLFQKRMKVSQGLPGWCSRAVQLAAPQRHRSLPCNCFIKSPPKQGSMPSISDSSLNPGFPGCAFFIREPCNICRLPLLSWTSCPSAHTTVGRLHVRFRAVVHFCGVECACHEIKYCPFHEHHSPDNIKQIKASLPKERKNQNAHDPKPGVVSLLQHLRLEQ